MPVPEPSLKRFMPSRRFRLLRVPRAWHGKRRREPGPGASPQPQAPWGSGQGGRPGGPHRGGRAGLGGEAQLPGGDRTAGDARRGRKWKEDQELHLPEPRMVQPTPVSCPCSSHLLSGQTLLRNWEVQFRIQVENRLNYFNYLKNINHELLHFI